MPDPLPGVPTTMAAIALLSLSGGFLDAVVYLLHGHVFANAMTGNLILLGVAILSHQHGEILHHVTPLAAFAAGVLVGKWLLQFHRAASLQFTLALQVVVLVAVGALSPHLSSDLLVALVAFTGAMQITTIRRADNVAFNTTFMTGNLRSVFEGAFNALLPTGVSDRATRNDGLKQFGVVGLTCASFFTGAILGSAAIPVFGNHSFFLSALLLLAAGLLLRRAHAPGV